MPGIACMLCRGVHSLHVRCWEQCQNTWCACVALLCLLRHTRNRRLEFVPLAHGDALLQAQRTRQRKPAPAAAPVVVEKASGCWWYCLSCVVVLALL